MKRVNQIVGQIKPALEAKDQKALATSPVHGNAKYEKKDVPSGTSPLILCKPH